MYRQRQPAAGHSTLRSPASHATPTGCTTTARATMRRAWACGQHSTLWKHPIDTPLAKVIIRDTKNGAQPAPLAASDPDTVPTGGARIAADQHPAQVYIAALTSRSSQQRAGGCPGNSCPDARPGAAAVQIRIKRRRRQSPRASPASPHPAMRRALFRCDSSASGTASWQS